MELISKIKGVVTGVVTGNPITSEFEIGRHVASGGPALAWKIHNAIKRTTKQEASVFVFEKRTLERYSRRDRELITECLKKGVSQLTRLRHPKILSVLHPLEESRETLAFATELVFASLANILGCNDNMPSPVPPDIKDHQLYDVEIKYGLLQITEGLTFLHNDVKMMHGNLNPETILVNKQGAWKIAGFDCCIPNSNPQGQAPLFTFREWNPDLPPVIQPHLDYLAPEFCVTMSCDTASDMYSLAAVIYTIYNQGKPLFQCNQQLHTFKKNAQELLSLPPSLLRALPSEVQEHVKMLLNIEPTVRPDADQLSKIPFFEDIGSMTLQYLDSLMQRDNLQKSQFFKGLPKVISKLPTRVCLQRILPSLYIEFTNHDMIPFLLPSILQIAEEASKEEYTRHILPKLIPVFKLKEPIQIQLLFLQNMNLLLSKTPANDVKNHVLPMVYGSLESSSPQIQELCLNILPTFANLIDYSSMKNALMPRIKKLCLSTNTLSVRVNCLLCIGKLLEYMDKWYVLDEVFPILQQVPSREPAVLMSVLGIYQVTLTHKKLGITKDILATKVLPSLIAVSIDNNLNLQQFNAFMSVIKDMLSRVEAEHRSKLEQLDTIKQEQHALRFGAEEVNGAMSAQNTAKSDSMMDKFLSGFGMGSVFTGGGKTETSNATGSVASESLGSMSQESGPSPTREQKQGKVPLSMEDKQRLVRELEQQRRYKSQGPLQPKQEAKSTPKPNTKDLTATLMNTSIAPPPQSKAPLYGSKPAVGMGGVGLGSTSMGSTLAGTSMAARTGAPGTTSYGGLSTMTPMQPSMKPTVSQTNANITNGGQFVQQKKIDMSSFDSLLPTSSAPQMSLNQMQTSINTGTVFGAMGQQGLMGNQGIIRGQNMTMGGIGTQNMIGNPGMMGNRGMPGSPAMMGYQGMIRNPNIMGNPSNMGSQGMIGSMGQQNTGFGTPVSNNQQNSMNASNDLKDIFG